jgi:uncharacterized damage-inducible protein DinB
MEMDNAILDGWRANSRATSYLVENLPADAWQAALPDSPRKTIRSIAAHLHNSRRLWFKSLAKFDSFRMPARVDPIKVAPAALLKALESSHRQMLRLLEAGIENGGDFPGVTSRFIWGAMPRNVLLFLAYAVSHEAHHRGQILLVARVAGHRLPSKLAGGLWQWSSRLRES